MLRSADRNSRRGGKNEQQTTETEGKPGQEDTRLRSERRKGLFREEKGALHHVSGPAQLVGRPRNVARASGTPKSLILTRLAVGARALWANRSAHESREWARCARERIGGDETCWGWSACDCCLSLMGDTVGEGCGDTMDATMITHVPTGGGQTMTNYQKITGRYLGPCTR